MREILFRGRQKGGTEWFKGDLSYLVHDKKVCYIFPTNGYNSPDCYEVDPDTVGQYAGEVGENGAIFEGDIVEFFGMRGVVVQAHGAFGVAVSNLIDYNMLESKLPFNNGANFCFNDNFISFWELWWNYEQDDYPLFEVKVIGNVWDNPELLED